MKENSMLPSENVIVVNEDNFDEKVLKSKIPVFIDFWAEWCWPCKILEPTFYELAREFNGKILFARVNVDENPGLAQKYSIMAIPTLILIKDAKEVERIIGAAPKKELVQVLKKYALG
jgi:thioredoxin 1